MQLNSTHCTFNYAHYQKSLYSITQLFNFLTGTLGNSQACHPTQLDPRMKEEKQMFKHNWKFLQQEKTYILCITGLGRLVAELENICLSELHVGKTSWQFLQSRKKTVEYLYPWQCVATVKWLSRSVYDSLRLTMLHLVFRLASLFVFVWVGVKILM